MIGVNGECDVYMQLLPCFMTHPGEFKAQGGKFMGANLKVFSLLNKFQQLFFFVYLIASFFFFFLISRPFDAKVSSLKVMSVVLH